MLNALGFGSDPFNICEYVMRRLNNSDFQVIVKMTRADIAPTTYVLLQNCQPTSASVERAFFMLKNVLRTNRNFLSENVKPYIMLVCLF